MTSPALQVTGLWKEYPGTTALKNVTLGFAPGRVHAVIGKNGAGKSSLVKIVAGALRPTRGRIELRGEPVELRSPREAMARGIATVYQELSLLPELSVAENILLGRLPRRLGGIAIDWPATFERARALLAELGMELDPRRRVAGLGMARRQVVEIAKAMSLNPAVLMLDEPTSSLAHDEVAQLFRLIRALAARGVAIIYISHRLQELREIADDISVLRDGELIGTIAAREATAPVITQMMFGEVHQPLGPGPLPERAEPVLEARGLTRRGKFSNVSFTVRRGEIVGLAGVIGSGRTEILRAIFGAEPFDSGELRIEGRPAPRPTPRRMKALGVAMIQEDRKDEGLVLTMSILDNLCLAGLGRVAAGGVIWSGRQRAAVGELVRRVQLKAPGLERSIGSLSGGNQQKVVIGNWLLTRPRVMLFDEPTRGIDVQARGQIFQIIRSLSAEGIGSLFVSSELEELLEVCHRLLIVCGGRITGEVEVAGLPLERLVQLVTEGTGACAD